MLIGLLKFESCLYMCNDVTRQEDKQDKIVKTLFMPKRLTLQKSQVYAYAMPYNADLMEHLERQFMKHLYVVTCDRPFFRTINVDLIHGPRL